MATGFKRKPDKRRLQQVQCVLQTTLHCAYDPSDLLILKVFLVNRNVIVFAQ